MAGAQRSGGLCSNKDNHSGVKPARIVNRGKLNDRGDGGGIHTEVRAGTVETAPALRRYLRD